MQPRASIVIVTSDRCRDLQRCLRELQQHLAAPDAPPCEVLTVHAPHDVESLTMVRREFPWVEAHTAPARGIGLQRNLGACAARGEIVVYLDDDAWPRAGWIQALVQAFADGAVVAASGPVFRGDGSLQCERLAASPLGRIVPLAKHAPLPRGMAPTFSGCNLAIRRSALFACGGFDENFVYQPDDIDVCRRLFARAGKRPEAFAYHDEIAVFHESSPGPFRRSLHDRAWYTVARDTIYFGFRHATTPRAVFGAGLLQLPKLARFFVWFAAGKLGPNALLRCVAKQTAGIAAGYAKGWSAHARLPLSPLPAEPPFDATGGSPTATVSRQEQTA